MAEFLLFQRVVDLSVNKTWDECKKEWVLIGINKSDVPQKCLCGHYPILELCFFKNNQNENEIMVGNCCVNKFFEDKKSNKMFIAFGKGKINKEIIELAYNKGFLVNVEYTFLMNTWRKRKITPKQSIWFNKLKERILEVFRRGRLR